jgi:hypothetical protein
VIIGLDVVVVSIGVDDDIKWLSITYFLGIWCADLYFIIIIVK